MKSERLTRLQALIDMQQQRFNAGMRGLETDVLIERRGKKPGQIVGRSPWLQAVQVDAPESLAAEIVSVRIELIGANSLFGALSGEFRERISA